MSGPSWQVAALSGAFGVVGGALGALLIGFGQHPTQVDPDVPSAHDQDVVLCTTYALVTAGIHPQWPQRRDALAAIPPLRLGLAENPGADPRVRAAITESVGALDAILARGAKAQGLSEPPAFDQEAVTAAFKRTQQVCGLAD